MSFSWSELDNHRRAVRRRWPRIWSLPVIPRAMRFVAGEIESGNRVIDVGGSDGAFGRRLAEGVSYEVVDVDPAHEADFRALDDVADANADVVVCFETIEHLSLEEAYRRQEELGKPLRRSRDAAEATKAFAEKRDPVWEGR